MDPKVKIANISKNQKFDPNDFGADFKKIS